MSNRAELRDRVRDNLDDTDNANYRWSNQRLNRLLDAERRAVALMLSIAAPGKHFKVSEDLGIVAGTQEYNLQLGVRSIARVERIAENGSALSQPIPIEKIDYSERANYQTATRAHRGAQYYYVYLSNTGGIPIWQIGFVPTPQTTGNDIRVHEFIEVWLYAENRWDPTAPGGAGTADDQIESGLTDLAEDLVVVRTTLAALAQRPPSSDITVRHFRDLEAKLAPIVMTSEGDAFSQDTPREVIYEDPQ